MPSTTTNDKNSAPKHRFHRWMQQKRTIFGGISAAQRPNPVLPVAGKSGDGADGASFDGGHSIPTVLGRPNGHFGRLLLAWLAGGNRMAKQPVLAFAPSAIAEMSPVPKVVTAQKNGSGGIGPL
jgi:hypothetical protein